jgi:BTB/POZ domain
MSNFWTENLIKTNLKTENLPNLKFSVMAAILASRMTLFFFCRIFQAEKTVGNSGKQTLRFREFWIRKSLRRSKHLPWFSIRQMGPILLLMTNDVDSNRMVMLIVFLFQACEDGKILQAHKMVLGICSPYFRSMLARNPCKHPTFILKDINHSTMSQILEFMYKGEVLVKQTDFSTFMRISKMFKIKGLMDADDEPPFIDVPVIPPPHKYTPSPKIAKLAQSSRVKPTPTITSIRPASVQSNKRRHESPMQSPTHKQIKYEEESNDPLVQEADSIYEDEVLEEEPDEEMEHKYTTTTTYDIQPTDEIHVQHEHDDQEIEQQSIEQHESEMVEEHEELEEDDDDEFDDQGET